MPTIKVLLGRDRKPFDLPMKVVRLTMPSIEAALNGLGEKETHNTLILPQVEPTTFEYMRDWALTTEIELPQNDGGANSSLFWSILTNVYILAEDQKATTLKRYIIDTIYTSIRDNGYGPSSDTIQLIYEKTSGTSGLRRIVIAFFVWQAAEGWWNIDQDANDEADWVFCDMPEAFKTEVAITTFERVHLMDDGNPFNDAHETEETGFGPDYFYDDDEARIAAQKWLRNDPNGLRPEEEWDAARFQVEKETAEDRAMINDDEKVIRKEEMDAKSSKDPTDLDGEMDFTVDEDSADSDEGNGPDGEPLKGDGWLELMLEVDPHEALQLIPTLHPRPQMMLDLLLAQEAIGGQWCGLPLQNWADEMDMSMYNVYRTAEELSDTGMVEMHYTRP